MKNVKNCILVMALFVSNVAMSEEFDSSVEAGTLVREKVERSFAIRKKKTTTDRLSIYATVTYDSQCLAKNAIAYTAKEKERNGETKFTLSSINSKIACPLVATNHTHSRKILVKELTLGKGEPLPIIYVNDVQVLEIEEIEQAAN